MFFKLAARNVRRSIRDYLVYFLTLMLSVCIFYMFNSVDAQLVMLHLADNTSTAATSVVIIIQLLSVVVAVVLAFLIMYANGFMMKRRKRELGLYMMLGMSNRKVAGIMVAESLLIGLFSLAAGIGLGYFASQGMSVATAKLFEVQVEEYHFVYSPSAVLKTCVSFAIIFVLVMIFNVVTVSRHTLSTLLGSTKHNEMVRVKSRGGSIVLVVAGIGVIALSYWIVFYVGFASIIYILLPAIGINFAGTLLLLYGCSGLALSARHHAGRYYKGLRMFSERQLASRVNTNTVSMAFICTLLFLMLVIVSSTSAVNSVVNETTQGTAPFDVSFTTYAENPDERISASQAAQEIGVPMDRLIDVYEYPVYRSGVLQGQIAVPEGEAYTDSVKQTIAQQELPAITKSAFNTILMLQGFSPMELGEGQFALACNNSIVQDALTAFVQAPSSITVGGQTLEYSRQPAFGVSLWTSRSAGDGLTLIVPDDAVAGLPTEMDVLVANYSASFTDTDSVLGALNDTVIGYATTSGTGTDFRMARASEVRMSNNVINASMTFAGLYIGMVFLVAGAAVLALQMLSGAADDRPQYDLLRKIGAPRRMIDRAILSQVAIYFFAPLALAAVHSVFGMTYMATGLGAATGTTDLASGMLGMALLICAIYGVYFVATYLGCRAIVSDKDTGRVE